MALTRKFLSALGVETEKVDEIIEAHTETVKGLKAEIDKYKDDADKLPALQKELEELKELTAKSEKDPYKVKYEALKEDYEEFKKGIEEKETTQKKEAAYTKLLKDAGVSSKRIASILKVTDLDGIELDGDGNAKNAEKLTETIKSEWSDFIQTKQTEGASVANPPAGSTGTVKTKKEIMEIKDTAERQAAWKDYLTANQKGT